MAKRSKGLQIQQQQRPVPGSINKKRKSNKVISRNILLFCIVVLAALTICLILVLSGLNIIEGPWTLILTTIIAVLGLVLALFQVFPSLVHFSPLESATTISTSVSPLGDDSSNIHSHRVISQPYVNRNGEHEQHAQFFPSSPPTTNAPSPSSKNTQNALKDFLISYADPDLAQAEWIAAQLEGAGYSTHLKQWDLEPGSNVIVELDAATKETQRTILVLSSHYLAAFDEHPEWTVAFRQDLIGKGRKVLPIYIAECQDQLKGLLGSIVPIDLAGMDEATARQKLLDGVHIGKRRPTTSPSFPLGL